MSLHFLKLVQSVLFFIKLTNYLVKVVKVKMQKNSKFPVKLKGVNLFTFFRIWARKKSIFYS